MRVFVYIIAQELIEFLVFRTVRSIDFTIETRRSRLDINVVYHEIFSVPMKSSLESMSVVGADTADPERKLIDNIIYKISSIYLILSPMDFSPIISRA